MPTEALTPVIRYQSQIAVSSELLIELRQYLVNLQLKTEEMIRDRSNQQQMNLLHLHNETSRLLIKVNSAAFQARLELAVEYRYMKLKIGVPTSHDFRDIHDNNPFLRQIVEIVLSQIENRNLRPIKLCKCLGISRSQLYRKMKDQTNIPIGRFIRLVRLRVAKHYLLKTSMRVSEIAYRVGFKSPSYFSRAFLQEFGSSPRDIRS